MWHFGKHRHKLLIVMLNTTASCGISVGQIKTNKLQSPSYTLFSFLFFFLYPPAELCSADERRQKTQTSLTHMQARSYADARNRMLICNLDPKHGHRHTNTQKEASVIKASVGPGEQRRLFQTPELPHWYHSVQFCCNNSVCPPTRAAWPRQS